jgi:hypothetical protein
MNALIDEQTLKPKLWENPAKAPCSRTLSRMRKRGLLPYVKFGASVYYDLEAVRHSVIERLSARSHSK